jgi:hypothetical protein
MATQRVIPIDEENAPNQNIVINSAFQASPRAFIMLPTSGVTFTNNSGTVISIQFVPNVLNPAPGQQIFNNINSLQSGSAPSPPQTPNNLNNGNGSVNYYVVSGGVPYGPYGIQVGAGPMQVLFTLNGDQITCSPNPVAIPPYNNMLQQAGTIAMFPDDASNNYGVGWPTMDPFTPPITTPDGLPHANGPLTVVNDYNYNVTSPTPADGGNGSGTVRIKGT